jgi:hypothetical protein
LIGPAGIWLNVPELSPHIREINWFLRNRFPLDSKLTELIILVTARESDAQIEWSAHEPAALKAGLSQHVVDIVKHRQPIKDVAPQEAAIKRLAELPDLHAAAEMADTPEGKEILTLYASGQDIVGRSFLAPPGLPAARVAELRAAFDATMKDPELKAEIMTAGADFNPLTGVELQQRLGAQKRRHIQQATLGL